MNIFMENVCLGIEKIKCSIGKGNRNYKQIMPFFSLNFDGKFKINSEI